MKIKVIMLLLILVLGSGYAKDLTVKEFLKKVTEDCNNGDAIACTTAGSIYYVGTKVAKDYAKAFKFFIKACDGGEADGCTLLGGMYDLGKGVKQDKEKAAKYYKKACEGGSAGGCVLLRSIIPQLMR